MRYGIIGAILAMGLAGQAAAHPHVFIDAGIEVIFDAEGRAEALRIEWRYDELFSMLLVEEQGLDPDFDGALTEAETAALSGFDMDWAPDFAGDTYALAGATPVGLSRPEGWTARYEGGRVISTHLRRLDRPVAADEGLIVQVYDPSFYTSYVLALPSLLSGPVPAGCVTEIWEPDRAAADAQLQAAMQEYSGEDAEFPAIGAAYAEELRLICPGG
jgi:ABC-type uncharacterized transport system substrate-binding protein